MEHRESIAKGKKRLSRVRLPTNGENGVGNRDYGMQRLLIIACSAKKLAVSNSVPALERYDGPAFRVLRKYLREVKSDLPAVLILSAKFGLIAADQEIPYYDCRLTREAALALRPSVLEAARGVLRSRAWSAVGVCAGKDYQLALEGLVELVPDGVRVDVVRGGLGPRLTALRTWLMQGESLKERPRGEYDGPSFYPPSGATR
jgi:hypothetical protein